ncbi:MAG: hypothetical protein ACHQHN_05880 [Sphingobacteriales bacterium]
MMKRYLLAALLFIACTGGYAQSLSFGDLLNLTSMPDAQSHDLLVSSKGFKQGTAQTLNGKTYVQYTKVTKGTPDKNESVLIGTPIKSATGILTHEIIFNTTQSSDLDNLLAEAKKSNLTLVFQGADQTSNIYRFDNSLFRASISLAFDKKSGNVDVQQK